MRILFGALAFLVLLLAAAVLLLPSFVPQSYVQRQLGRLLAQETGLQLQDARRLSLSVFPRLGITVEGVSARMQGGAAGAPLVRAERIFTAIRPQSLFGGRLRVSKVTIENPSVLFHVDASGRSNWDSTGLAGDRTAIRLAALGDGDQILRTAASLSEPASAARLLPAIDIDIINGSLDYRDDVRSRTVRIQDFNLSLRGSERPGPVTLEGGLRIEGEPMRLSATATPSFSGPDRTASLRMDIRSDALSADLGGALTWQGRPQFNGTAQIETRSGAALGRILGGNEEAFARFDGTALSGKLEVSHHELVLSEGKFVAKGAEADVSAFADFDGHMRARLDNLSLHGGTGAGQVTLDTRQAEMVLAGAFRMRDVDGLALTRGVSGFDWLSGRADVEIEIAGGGASFDGLAQTLKGNARLTLANGAIEGLDLPLIVAKAKQGEIGKWRREAGRRTEFDRLNASFTIANGVAETKDLALSGPNIEMSGEGRTDIPRQRLDYRLKTKVTAAPGEAAPAKPEEQEQASLAIPLIIKGDWEKPDIMPDIENALKDTDSLVGTAKLFGKSVEKLTDGKVKAEDFSKALDSLFGKKKKKKDAEAEAVPE